MEIKFLDHRYVIENETIRQWQIGHHKPKNYLTTDQLLCSVHDCYKIMRENNGIEIKVNNVLYGE